MHVERVQRVLFSVASVLDTERHLMGQWRGAMDCCICWGMFLFSFFNKKRKKQHLEEFCTFHERVRKLGQTKNTKKYMSDPYSAISFDLFCLVRFSFFFFFLVVGVSKKKQIPARKKQLPSRPGHVTCKTATEFYSNELEEPASLSFLTRL